MTMQIRAALDHAGLHDTRTFSAYGPAANNEVLIDLDVKETSEKALDRGKKRRSSMRWKASSCSKKDLNNSSSLTIKNYLMDKDPAAPGLRRGPKIYAPRRRPSSIIAIKTREGCSVRSIS